MGQELAKGLHTQLCFIPAQGHEKDLGSALHSGIPLSNGMILCNLGRICMSYQKLLCEGF